MFNLPLKSGGGVFVPDGGVVSGSLASGQTGVLLSVPEVSRKVYKITYLAANTTAGNQPGISLVIDGETIHSEEVLDDQQPTNLQVTNPTFLVAQTYGTVTLNNPRQYDHIFCRSFSLAKNAGNTTRAIGFVYEVGSIK